VAGQFCKSLIIKIKKAVFLLLFFYSLFNLFFNRKKCLTLKISLCFSQQILINLKTTTTTRKMDYSTPQWLLFFFKPATTIHFESTCLDALHL